MKVIIMTKKTKQFLICIAVPLLVGGLSALITRKGMDIFETINKPPLSPPGWIFPVVWTVLFILMGIASYLVLVSGKPRGEINRTLTVYGIQLIFNFFWSIFFFNFPSIFFPLSGLCFCGCLFWLLSFFLPYFKACRDICEFPIFCGSLLRDTLIFKSIFLTEQ